MKRKITLLVLSITLVLTIIIGSTYSALFKVNETEVQSYETGTLLVTSSATNNSVTLTNALPMSDTDGTNLTPYTFKITNTGNLTFNFDVKFLSTTTDTTNMIEPQYIKIKVNNNPVTTLNSLSEGVILENQTLEPGKSLEVTLRVWLTENIPNTQIGKVFSAKVTTEGQATYTTESLPSYPKIDSSGANAPGYVEALIPIMYDESTSKWVKADTTSSTSQYGWYDYDAKKWANAVLVKENSYIEVVGETNKTVSIANEPVPSKKYISSNKGIHNTESISIFTFTTGENGGTLSFDYSVSSEEGYDKFTVTLNGTTIVSYISGTHQLSYDTTVVPNTSYSLQVIYTKDDAYSENDDQATISNIILPNNLTNPLVVTSSGDYGWTESTTYVYTTKTYSSYNVDKDGNYILESKNELSATNSIGKYICSDTTSTECSTMYQIKGASGNNITSVDTYTTNYIEGVRTTYQNASAGTPIAESDILAYYVWIPRYKYKVWNINKEVGTDTYDAYTKGIEIEFEEDDKSTGTITCGSYSYGAPSANKGEPNETCSDVSNGEGYYTHPAFTFGTDELSGFWMGKFELSSTEQKTENYGGGERIDLEPRILPDVMSWRYNRVGNFWKVIYDMQTNGNIYGLPTDRKATDSHMLTNMEWGAAAYLTHSKYGRCTGGENSTCTEVAINNSGEKSYYTNYTGRSSGDRDNWEREDTGTYTYNQTNGYSSSTTGNIYGIYDMSGGANEFVMGNMGTSAGQTTEEYRYYASSAGSNYPYTGFEKYLTTYAYGTTYGDNAAYNRGRLGDATSEIVLALENGWYLENIEFLNASYPWFLRGGYFGNEVEGYLAGVFYFYYDFGNSSDYASTRAALSVVAS